MYKNITQVINNGVN